MIYSVQYLQVQYCFKLFLLSVSLQTCSKPKSSGTDLPEDLCPSSRSSSSFSLSRNKTNRTKWRRHFAFEQHKSNRVRGIAMKSIHFISRFTSNTLVEEVLWQRRSRTPPGCFLHKQEQNRTMQPAKLQGQDRTHTGKPASFILNPMSPHLSGLLLSRHAPGKAGNDTTFLYATTHHSKCLRLQPKTDSASAHKSGSKSWRHPKIRRWQTLQP